MKDTAKSLLFLTALATTTGAFAQSQYITPIEHVIIVIQENRTPDNLFQDQNLITKGADIRKASDAVAWPLATCWDIGHSHKSWTTEYTYQLNGQGFCGTNVAVPSSCQKPACPQDSYAQNTAQDKTIQPYWDIAEAYGFANYFFQTNQGPSFPAHQFLFSGTSAPVAYPITGSSGSFPLYRDFDADNAGFTNSGCIATNTQSALASDIDPTGATGYYYTPPDPVPVLAGYPCYEHPTLSDQLEGAGLSWRYYGYNIDKGIWNTPTAIQHICKGQPGGSCNGTDWNTHVDLYDWDIFNDITVNCSLSSVSWVIPDGNYSDHPGGNNHGGPDWVANIVNAVGQSGCKNGDGSSYWNSTAIFIMWDDWGGFYDHVSPYEHLIDNNNNCSVLGCGYVAGFRVPLLVVSAYTGTNTTGYISGPCQSGVCSNNKPPYWHDFGSVLNFTQYVFSGFSGMTQGGIGPSNWLFDDYWAPDYWNNPKGDCTQQVCPYGLSDFFHFSQKRSFKKITAQTYQGSDFVNLSAFGGMSASEAPDEETP